MEYPGKCTSFDLIYSTRTPGSLENEPVLISGKIIWEKNKFPSRQILVPRTSRGLPPPTSPGRSLKILFDRSRDVPIRRHGDVLKWRLGDVLIWRSRDVPRRLIWDVPRMFSGRPLEDLESTQTWMSQIFLDFSFRTYSIDQI